MKNYIDKGKTTLNRLNLLKRLTQFQYNKDPVYIFHHMPKCGGTSLGYLLNKWFIVKRDYRKDWNSTHNIKYDLNKFRSIHCLAGHWELPEVYLYKRYPEVFENGRFKVFTFLRDPLEHSLSLYRYEKENNQTDIVDMVEHFQLRPNYMATILGANKSNYKKIIDKYEFVGIVEKMDESVRILAEKFGKPFKKIPVTNVTAKKDNFTSQNISESVKRKFRRLNELDYLIYSYSANKLRELMRFD